MRFRADVEVDRLSDVLVVPLESVRPQASGPVVYRRRGGAWVETPVELGARNATHAEVRGGLEEGDRIARRPPEAGRGERT
jgi:multidrug efflux pump subunit AcrA (membrane-fusion protein)